MITIHGDLILEKDTEYNESLTVEGNILGKDVNRYNLKVCGDLDCLNLNCWNLDCRNLNCGDLDCWNLKAKKVLYYAVAFAYNNMEVESIKGRRENCKHFCLDGQITIKDEKPKCEKCGRELCEVKDD